MTWGSPPAFQQRKSKVAKLIAPEQLAASGTEDGHQAALFCWAATASREYYPLKYLHAIPNGGQRHIAEATKMVAAGLRKGVLDIFLPYSVGIYHGCYIELKIEKRKKEKNGGMSDAQIDFMMYCRAANYYCKVCYSWKEARDTLINYLEGKL